MSTARERSARPEGDTIERPSGIVSVGPEVDLAAACSAFRDTTLMGNLDPLLLRDASPDAARAAARHCVDEAGRHPAGGRPIVSAAPDSDSARVLREISGRIARKLAVIASEAPRVADANITWASNP